MRRIAWTTATLALLIAFGGCRAEVEDPGALPDVDVRGGSLPEVDVDPADVRISTDTQTVVTPDVDVVPR